MNIKVQKQKPNRREGAQGELRLVMMGGGSYLYVKGGNQWYTLNLLPSESAGTVNRQIRGDLQRNIVVVANEADAGEHDGDILDPAGSQKSTRPPHAPL